MHFVVVLPAGSRRDERASGAHLQKHKKKSSHSGGPRIGVFCCSDALFDTVIWFICVKFWIHDIFVRPQHPHGAENRFSEFATKRVNLRAGCGGQRGGGAGRFFG